MYKSSDFISITDVRKNISSVIDKLPEDKHKIIFRNNRPIAVLVDFYYFEKMLKQNDVIIEELDWSEEFIWTNQHKELLSLMKSA